MCNKFPSRYTGAAVCCFQCLPPVNREGLPITQAEHRTSFTLLSISNQLGATAQGRRGTTELGRKAIDVLQLVYKQPG